MAGMRDEASIEPPQADCIPRDEPSSSPAVRQERTGPATRQGLTQFAMAEMRDEASVEPPTGRVLSDSVPDGFTHPRHNAFCGLFGPLTVTDRQSFVRFGA